MICNLRRHIIIDEHEKYMQHYEGSLTTNQDDRKLVHKLAHMSTIPFTVVFKGLTSLSR